MTFTALFLEGCFTPSGYKVNEVLRLSKAKPCAKVSCAS